MATRKTQQKSTDTTVKALVLKGADSSVDVDLGGQVVDEESTEGIFAKAGALKPRWDPNLLIRLHQNSASVRPNVDAYKVNIDGFGHRFEPCAKLDDDEAGQRVRDLLEDEADDDAEVSDEEVEATLKRFKRQQRRERRGLERFFGSCVQDRSFQWLRKITREDMEVTGNGYWEVLENAAGAIARFVWMPSRSTRMTKLVDEPVLVEEPVRVSPFEYDVIKVRRRFRQFVQIEDGVSVAWFKQFGDPRTFSRETGKLFMAGSEPNRKKDLDLMLKKEPNALPANAVIHFSIPALDSPYGAPRWTGAMLAAMGSRAVDEVNYLFFDNKAIPPLAMLVNGGRLSRGSAQRIEDFVEQRLKGRKNFHKILILEATSARERDTSAQRPHIELKPLLEHTQKDALFQEYDARNEDKVGAAFRLPGLLRGNTKDLNRATAFAALRLADDQVFQPERDDFDAWTNNVLLPALGASCWRFVSQAPVSRDPEVMGRLVDAFVERGVLVPAEGRELAGDIFNRDFERINKPWTRVPFQFTLAAIQTGQEGNPAAGASGSKPKPGEEGADPKKPDDDLEELQGAREALHQFSSRALAAALGKDDDEGVVVLEASPEEMRRWIDEADPEGA